MRSPYGSAVTIEDWRAFQESERRAYLRDFQRRGDHFGHFSIQGLPAVDRFAALLSEVPGPILDVGCGVLPLPAYLEGCDGVMGVDPYFGEYTRSFPFAQAIGERLPFKDGHFAAVALMSSLDHVMDPRAVLGEARRVLRRGGELFVWYISRKRVDPKHTWSFGGQELNRALGRAGFGDFRELVFGGGNGFPKTHGVIARVL